MLIPIPSGGGAAYEELLEFVYLTPVGVVKFGSDGTVDLINPAASNMLLALKPGSNLANIYDALLPLCPELPQLVRAFERTSGTIISRQRFDGKFAGDESVVWSVTVQRVNETVYMAVLVDVTQTVAQERKLVADDQRFRAIFESVHDYAIYTVTLAGFIEEWNASLRHFGGWEAKDVEGRHVSCFFPSDEIGGEGVEAVLADAMLAGFAETEGWLSNRNGTRLWGNVIFTALPNEHGTVRGFVVVARDMTERKRMEEELQQLATTDPLTGAFNRRYGNACLSAEFQRRSRSAQPFAVLMLDIDEFKSINDKYGHDSGDAVLCAVVAACKSTLRTLDVFARWGGEEFLAVLPGATPEGALFTAERLRKMLEALPIAVAGERSIAMTVSIGIAAPVNGDVDELLRRADDALYAAKSGGRNRVVLAA